MYLNRAALIGELSKDPEARSTSGGQSITTASIKLVKHYESKGEKKVRTCYVDLKGWGKAAEALAALSAGDVVLVDGEIDTESWDDKDSGKKRYKTLLNVVAVQALAPRAEVARAERRGRVETTGADNPLIDPLEDF